MRLGLIARCDDSGLGNQTLGIYQHLKPAKTLVVDISDLNGMVQHPERYPDGILCAGLPSMVLIDEFLRDLDLVFTCETPYDYDLGYYLFHTARKLGVKTILAPNYEFLDYFLKPDLPKPDLFALPTMWHWEDFPFENKTYLHVPVDTALIKARRIKEARTFLHIVGKPALHDRNGTRIVVGAAKLISWARFIILTQAPLDILDLPGNVEIRVGNVDNYWEMYKDGDVLVLPRRYGGNCLLANEALASGMPVIMPDIDPNNRWLPKEWLVPAEKTGEITDRTPIDVMSVKPFDLAQRIYEFAKDSDFSSQSVKAWRIANRISWVNLKQLYIKTFEKLVK